MKPTAGHRDDLLRRLKEPGYAAAYLNQCLEDDDDEGGLLQLHSLRQLVDATGMKLVLRPA
jgi:DNA-binding phage protein